MELFERNHAKRCRRQGMQRCNGRSNVGSNLAITARVLAYSFRQEKRRLDDQEREFFEVSRKYVHATLERCWDSFCFEPSLGLLNKLGRP